jgi:hypothetical protein
MVAPTDHLSKGARGQNIYEGDATLFKAELYAWNHPDAHDGWRKLNKGRIEVRHISGRH